MELEFGAVGWVGGAAAVLLAAIGVALLVFRKRLFRKSSRGRGRSNVLNQQRLEVLDTTIVDAERRLVLVRCDGVEHLIMVGGKSGDVVVENDVRKARGGAPAVDRPVVSAAAERGPALTARPAPKTGAEPRPAPSNALQAPAVQRPGLASIAAPPIRATPPPAPPPADPQFGRRDAAPQRRSPQLQAPPVPANRPADSPRPQGRVSGSGGERPARPASASSHENVGLPGASTPWPEPDSIESEIVQALRFERRQERPTPPPAPARDPALRERRESSATTLGDLAERLEEALAREVQSASHAREPVAEIAAPVVAEKVEAPPPEPRKRPELKSRAEPKERHEPAKPIVASVPDPEPRREPVAVPERREEAPVISLNSRRREAVDPLEDEMARLLGELTGDTKGR